MSEAVVNQIASLLLVWQQHTGQPLHPALMQRMFYDFLQSGLVEDDLRCVLEHLVKQNRKRSEAKYRCRIVAHKIVGDLELFASLLGEARACERNQVKRTPAERVLATRTGGVTATATGDTAKPVREVLRAMKEL